LVHDGRDPLRLQRALLGFLALSLFTASIGFTWVYLNRGFEGGVPVRAVFASPGVGQLLPVGGDVKVRGVLVGTISRLELDDDGNAVVHMRLEDDAGIPAESRAEVRSKTAFGEKWVELIPPGPVGVGETLAAGSAIPVERTTEPVELELALHRGHELLSEIPLRELALVTRTLAEGFSGQEGDARRAIDRGVVALRAVNARADELDLALQQLAEFSEWLDDHDDDLVSFMRSLDLMNRALVGAAPEFRASMSSVPAFLNEFASFQEETEADLGRLIEDGATVAEIVAARSQSLVDIVVNLRAFTTVWNSMLSQPCTSLGETNLTCWHVYQMPGLESRGLYRRGQGPHEDEPGDPGHRGRSAATISDRAFMDLLAEYAGAPAPPDLARILMEPARELLPDLVVGGAP
jgi:virulence factor Mce-like protein